MRQTWQSALQRWVESSLIDPATADRIRAFEEQQTRREGQRWPVQFALTLGGIAVSAGIILFVASHWDQISPFGRFIIVLVPVAGLHIAGAFSANRDELLSTVLHTLGTIGLGAGIFLAAQIFSLQEHWPSGLMLWTIGAWIGWSLLRQASQATIAAMLTPAWLGGEWVIATEGMRDWEIILAEGLLLLAIAYLSAESREGGSLVHHALARLGAIAIIPCTFLVISTKSPEMLQTISGDPVPVRLLIPGWTIAIGVPLAATLLLRGRAVTTNLAAAVWALVLGDIVWTKGPYDELALYIWCGVGAVGLIAWGLGETSRERYYVGLFGAFATILAWLSWTERYGHTLGYLGCALASVAWVAWGVRAAKKEGINLGVISFAITVAHFYFSTLMDKLGRSVSLILFGIVFLLGGWLLERTRRRLLASLNRVGT